MLFYISVKSLNYIFKIVIMTIIIVIIFILHNLATVHLFFIATLIAYLIAI